MLLLLLFSVLYLVGNVACSEELSEHSALQHSA